MAEVLTGRLTGRPDPAAPLRHIAIGDLSVALGALEIRYLRVDGDELVRRLFVAVRDTDWGTVPPDAEQVDVAVDQRGITSTTSAVCSDPARTIELRWDGTLRCESDGSVEFAVEWTALCAFDYARIGICVLHPPSFAGGTYRARTPSGWIEGTLAHDIEPQLPGAHGFGEPLFPAFEELVLRRPDGAGVHVAFSGDLFELEDQRNWADASFKTYSTPLHVGPQSAAAGQVSTQRVAVTPLASVEHRRTTSGPRLPTVELGQPAAHTVPDVGVVLAARPMSPRAVELLGALRPAHLRVDLELDDGGWRDRLTEAVAIDVPLELAVSVDTDAGLRDLSDALREADARLARVLAFRAGSLVTPRAVVTAVRDQLAAAGLEAPVYGGTDALFADLNGSRPERGGLDGVAFPVVPTIHADDDLSLVETMSVFADIVRTARRFTDGLPVAVSPVTLRTRPQTDDRQSSLLAAVWTLGVASALAAQATESVTFFEAAGPRGVLDGDDSGAYPVYHVLADICSWQGGRVVPTTPSDVLAVGCLAVQLPDGRLSAVLVNALPERSSVQLVGFPRVAFHLRRLNEGQYDLALREPRRFRAEAEPAPADVIELEPYEVVRLDEAP